VRTVRVEYERSETATVTGRETTAVWWGASTVETVTCDQCSNVIKDTPQRTYFGGDYCGFPCLMAGTARHATNP
jgi:hypothetical protein